MWRILIGLLVSLSNMMFNIYGQNIEYTNLMLNEFKKPGFYLNMGQIYNQFSRQRTDVLFAGSVDEIDFHLRRDGVSFQLSNKALKGDGGISKNQVFNDKEEDILKEIYVYRIDMDWIGINNDFIINRGTELEGHYNYYLAGCPDGVTIVKSYESVTYKEIYDGIDLKWYGNDEGLLEYDYIISPESDLNEIKFKIKGAENIFIDEKGTLIIETLFGGIQQSKPVAYQGFQEIDAKWTLNENIVGFKVENYNRSLPLVIDPVVRNWGTYYGGGGGEAFVDFETDSDLNMYLTGFTSSTSMIATTGTHQVTMAGKQDAVVAKFNNTGVLQWATYYGGSKNDYGYASAVDGLFNTYLVGSTESDSGIATPGAFQTNFAGYWDGFIVKFDSLGRRKWATYFGNLYVDELYGVAIQSDTSIFVTGGTDAATGIATSGAHQSIYGGGVRDAILVKFDSSGQRKWSTYYGGSKSDIGQTCEVDVNGNIYLSGYTESSNKISTTGSHQSTHGGGIFDAFVVKFDANGQRQWGTYYGGSKNDFFRDLTVDDQLNVYLVGNTNSTNNISSTNSHQDTYGGGNTDAFLVKLDSTGSREWGTYYGIGSTGTEWGRACGIDKNYNVYMCGFTTSPLGISTSGSHQGSLGGDIDAFLVKFSSSGVRKWGTYYGGTQDETANGVYVDSAMNIFMMGGSLSDSNITTSGTHQSLYAGNGDGFLIKFKQCYTSHNFMFKKSCGKYTSPSGRYVWDQSGSYLDTLVHVNGCDSILHITLNIISVDTTVSRIGNTLIASQFVDSYQWVNCSNGYIPIPNDTNKVFTTNTNGLYAVILTRLGCADTSRCVNINSIGLALYEEMGLVSVYPNPADNNIAVDISNSTDFERCVLMDATGRVVYNNRIIKKQFNIDCSTIPSGIYFISLWGESVAKFKLKILVQH